MAMTNEDFIKKYGNDNIILAKTFQDKDGKEIKNWVCPLKIDNRQLCSPTDNQGDVPHCAGFSAAQLAEAIHWKRHGYPIQLDANQIYAKAKVLDGRPDAQGTWLVYALKAATDIYALEYRDELEIGTFSRYKDPNVTVNLIKRAIHRYDFLLCGFYITTDWYFCYGGRHEITTGGEFAGGHAVVACGYDETGLYIQNHWGRDWGANGFAKISWERVKKEFSEGAFITNAYAHSHLDMDEFFPEYKEWLKQINAEEEEQETASED